MNIVMLLEGPFPPDPRVGKEIYSLVDAGHYIYLLCSDTGSKDLVEKRDGWEIHRIKFNRSIFNKLRVTFLAFPLHLIIWKCFLSRTMKGKSVDAIHVHDLPLSKVAIRYAKKHNLKIVLDQHEYYSDWIVQTSYMNTFVGKVIKSVSNFKRYERKSLLAADLVITVTEPLRGNYIEEYNLPSDKIISIPNTPTANLFNTDNVKSVIVDRYKDEFILFYAGGIDSLRGIDMAIEALSHIRKEIPNAKIILGGKLTNEYDYTVAAKSFGVLDAVEYVGWIDEADLASYIKASDVCFFTPQADRAEINKTIATKNYQYAMMRCPQIVSNAKMMKEFVELNGYGYAVNSASEFSQRVLGMYNGTLPDLEFNPAGLQTWETTTIPLINKYESLV